MGFFKNIADKVCPPKWIVDNATGGDVIDLAFVLSDMYELTPEQIEQYMNENVENNATGRDEIPQGSSRANVVMGPRSTIGIKGIPNAKQQG